MKRIALVLILLLCVPALMLGAQAGQAAPAKKPPATKAPAEKAPGTAKKAGAAAQEEKVVITPSGLKYVDVKEGTGPQPKTGQSVSVKYIGTLENGKVFDDGTYTFKVGMGEVIKGWDEGVGTMKVGGRRKLIIPAKLAYGSQSIQGKVLIPPNSTLLFDCTLLSAK